MGESRAVSIMRGRPVITPSVIPLARTGIRKPDDFLSGR